MRPALWIWLLILGMAGPVWAEGRDMPGVNALQDAVSAEPSRPAVRHHKRNKRPSAGYHADHNGAPEHPLPQPVEPVHKVELNRNATGMDAATRRAWVLEKHRKVMEDRRQRYEKTAPAIPQRYERNGWRQD